MKTSVKLSVLWIAVVTGATFSVMTIAGSYTADELRLMPRFCKAKSSQSTKTERKYWSAKMGSQNWVHMHHYCYAERGTIQANRASSPNIREDRLKGALRNYAYVEGKAVPGFILMPELKVKMGKILIRLGRSTEAVGKFHEAINLNTKFVPAYKALGDFYADKGMDDKAREIYAAGLRHAPKSKSLKRRMQKVASAR